MTRYVAIHFIPVSMLQVRPIRCMHGRYVHVTCMIAIETLKVCTAVQVASMALSNCRVLPLLLPLLLPGLSCYVLHDSHILPPG
jgi:hypothetical protein